MTGDFSFVLSHREIRSDAEMAGVLLVSFQAIPTADTLSGSHRLISHLRDVFPSSKNVLYYYKVTALRLRMIKTG